MSKEVNHKFGDPAIRTSLTGGNLSCLPCPNHPQPRPYLHECRRVLFDPRANPRACYCSLKLLRSRPRVRAGILALPVARVLLESLMQPHLTSGVGFLLVSHMSYIPLQSPQLIRGRL